jgi:ectoine hydroxylase-related dioxygenase (phytanoyl-CoA dioxygenase family)
MNEQQKKQLDEEGYVMLPNLLSADQREELLTRLEALWAEEGAQAGAENYIERNTRRLANLANKGDVFRPIFAHPKVLELVRAVVGPQVRLSMLNARDVLRNADPNQPIHADLDDPIDPNDPNYYACTAIWMLDDFTLENGATRLVPGSHLSRQMPEQVLENIFAPHPDEIAITGKAGDVLVFNGHCWHRGAPNETNNPRRAILAHYARAGGPTPPDSRRQHLSPENRAKMSAAELALLDFN